MDAKTVNDWLRLLERPATGQLAAFTGDETRKHGRYLVLISVVTILLSQKNVVITGGSLGVFRLMPSRVAYVVIPAGLVCLCLLAVYGFDLYRDWLLARHKRLPSPVDLRNLGKELALELNAGSERTGSLAKESQRLLNLRQRKYIELGLNGAAGEWAGNDDFEEDITTHEQPYNDWIKRQEEFSAYCKSDGLDTLQEEHVKIVLDRASLKKMEILLSNIKKNRLVDYLRVGTVVFVTWSLGVFAIVSAVRYVI